MSGMLSDSKILQTLREKEPLGMDALFERYYRPLVVFAESYLHDLQSAEDLVQEQMVKYGRNRPLPVSFTRHWVLFCLP